MKKILVPGLAAGIAMFVVMMAISMVFAVVFPELNTEYNSAVFRSIGDPLSYYMFLHPILVGLLLAIVWQNTQGIMKEKKPGKKGTMFGFYIWLILGIPGMLMSLSSFNLSVLIVLSWTVSILFQYLTAGIVFAYMDKK